LVEKTQPRQNILRNLKNKIWQKHKLDKVGLSMTSNYLESAIKQFEYYKLLGEKTFFQLTDEQLYWQYNIESNSIAIIVKHLWGNMLSRWTDFLTTDGEKQWRNRDVEFETEEKTREALLTKWNEAWTCLFDTLNKLKEEDLSKEIFIRNQGHTVIEAINRQLAHYPYHIGQIVFLGKMMCDEKWESLSISKGNSTNYNTEKFSNPKEKKHFTDEYLKKTIKNTDNNES